MLSRSSSRGYLWSAATDLVAAQNAGKQVVVLHVGDYDPSLDEVEYMARDAIALMLDVPPDSFDLRVEIASE